MISINKKGSTSIRTVFPLLLLVAAMVCVSATIFANTSEDVEGVEIGGINYTLNDADNTATVAQTPDAKGAVTIPRTVTYNNEQYTVTSVITQAFYDCSRLTSITIPDSVTSIYEFAFFGCSGLTKVTFGGDSALESIGAGAFFGCSMLSSITIPNSVTFIGMGAFADCSELTSISIPSGASIYDIAFDGCSGLTSVAISGKGVGSGDVLGTYFSGADWKIRDSASITTLIIDTTDEINIEKVNIVKDNTLTITYGSNNVVGADNKVIFNGEAVTEADRACKTYTGTEGQWIGKKTVSTLTLESNDPSLGTVSEGGNHSVGDTVEINASTLKGGIFKGWMDESGKIISTTPTHSLTLTEEKVKLTAIFEIIMVDLSVRADPSHQGEVKGSGTYEYGTIVKITATPNKGYKFVAWSDGNENAERSVKLTTDASLTAYFVEDDPDLCTITVVIKGNGNVYGMGTFAKGTVITLNASPDQGYSFQGWSHTPYAGQTVQLSVESDMVITATFSQNDTGIGGSNTTIDTTTVIIIVVVIVVIFGIVVAVSLIRGRGSV